MAWNRNKAEKRAEQEHRWQAEHEARLKEEARKEALSMWERIEEADTGADVKDILHRFAHHLGLED